MIGESSMTAFDPSTLLLAYLASRGCRHEWVELYSSEDGRIACVKCGLTAYVLRGREP
jgi:hypothetical protein